MSRLAERRARVELALVLEGDNLVVSELARELGVSRWTMGRDVAAVRERWVAAEQAARQNPRAERARMAGAFDVLARQAWEMYARLSAEPSDAGVALEALRLALDALTIRAGLLGLADHVCEWSPAGQKAASNGRN